MRTRILSVTPVNPLGVTASLTSKGSQDSRSVRLGEHRGAENALSLPRRVPRLSPLSAGCPHPSRCGAAPHRATFPKGKALRPLPLCRSPIKMCRHRRRSKAKPLRGSRGGSAAEHGGYLGEDRGAENAFNSPLWQYPIKMCAPCAHSFVFHAPEGTLHVPKARFICGTHVPSFSRFLRLKAGVEIPEKQTERQ